MDPLDSSSVEVVPGPQHHRSHHQLSSLEGACSLRSRASCSPCAHMGAFGRCVWQSGCSEGPDGPDGPEGTTSTRCENGRSGIMGARVCVADGPLSHLTSLSHCSLEPSNLLGHLQKHHTQTVSSNRLPMPNLPQPLSPSASVVSGRAITDEVLQPLTLRYDVH